MSIPDNQTIMLPLLRLISDGREYRFKNIVVDLGKIFKLNEKQMNQLLPSGRSFLFANRVGWARTYLKKAGLINAPRRGILSISQRGIAVLNAKPDKINKSHLQRFPEFVEFQNIRKGSSVSSHQGGIAEIDKQTPEEIIDAAYQNQWQSLAQEVIVTVRRLSPSSFERLVLELLKKMGYGGSSNNAGIVTRKTSDEGIDCVIKEDKLGLNNIYAQAKRWNINNKVGRPEIQKFVGALAGQKAKKGVFVTTSTFTREALIYSSKIEAMVILIDGIQLAQYMIEHNLGVSVLRAYEIKKLDGDYLMQLDAV